MNANKEQKATDDLDHPQENKEQKATDDLDHPQESKEDVQQQLRLERKNVEALKKKHKKAQSDVTRALQRTKATTEKRCAGLGHLYKPFNFEGVGAALYCEHCADVKRLS